MSLPFLHRWHVTTQDRLFAHLHALWTTPRGGDAPRVMVDAGSHAGHGPHKNVSDALLWLDRFHAPGSVVLAVDAFEDFAIDLQYRFDRVPPYSRLDAVNKTSLFVALAPRSDSRVDLSGMAHMHATCCIDRWCSHRRLEARHADHLCRLTRMRFGLATPDVRVTAYPSEFSDADGLIRGVVARDRRARYRVRTLRLDDVWRRYLYGRRIDFLKIDVDAPWSKIGIDALLRRKGAKVVCFEVDGAWGRGGFDRFVDLAANHGYDVFMKVPCNARGRANASLEGGGYTRATRLFPVATAGRPFVPTGFYVDGRTGHQVQDFLLVDADLMQRSHAESLLALPERMRRDCRD